ncbi:MAG: hypothetical protein LBV13_04350 [Methanomassiliicoccaceae archaeon]|jgi:hypothetical protein|nr:hypothetical protein [Methanomassiliicoccaceae archaeon]
MEPGKKGEGKKTVSWSPDSGAVSDRHPLKKAATRNPFWKFISKRVPLPFIITEFFFGAWMSCIAINLVGGFADPENPAVLLYAISAAYMVNIIWGIIDGWSYNLCTTIALSEDDRYLYRLLKNRNDAAAKERLIASLDSGPARHLGITEKENLLETILASDPDVHPKKVYRFKKFDYGVMAAFLMIDVFVATLTVLPFIILNDISTAMLFSRFVTISVFACVAYVSAKYMNRNWIFWVAIMSALGIFIAEATFLYS